MPARSSPWTRIPFKLEKASRIGATHTAASILEANLMLPELTEGRMADVVILTPGVLTGDLIAPAMALASKDGRVVTTAIAPFNQNQVDLNLFNFAMYNQALLGTVFGSVSPRVQIPNLLRLYEAGMLEIDDLITQEYSLDQVQDGYDDLAAGTNIRGIVTLRHLTGLTPRTCVRRGRRCAGRPIDLGWATMAEPTAPFERERRKRSAGGGGRAPLRAWSASWPTRWCPATGP